VTANQEEISDHETFQLEYEPTVQGPILQNYTSAENFTSKFSPHILDEFLPEKYRYKFVWVLGAII
jgi:hypothetical protein